MQEQHHCPFSFIIIHFLNARKTVESGNSKMISSNKLSLDSQLHSNLCYLDLSPLKMCIDWIGTDYACHDYY